MCLHNLRVKPLDKVLLIMQGEAVDDLIHCIEAVKVRPFAFSRKRIGQQGSEHVPLESGRRVRLVARLSPDTGG